MIPEGVTVPPDQGKTVYAVTKVDQERLTDRIQIEISTEAPGLPVLSEVYYPAWNAYVDGESAPVYRTDHLLRAVPIPEGEHTVELGYELRTLRAEMAVSLVTCVALVTLTVAAGARRWRKTGKKSLANEPTAESCASVIT